MKQTPNFNFNKPELLDSPPDITVMNGNWDTIDTKLKEFDEHKANNISQGELHGMRVNEIGELEYYNNTKEIWVGVGGFTAKNFYLEGQEYVDVTGGWKVGISSNTGTQRKEISYLYLETTQSSSSTSTRTYVTTNLIDLSKINTLYVEWENTDSVASQFKSNSQLHVSDVWSDGRGDTVNVRRYGSFSTTIDVLDVSTLSGKYYISIQNNNANGTDNRKTTLKVYRIWGEI